MSDKVTLKGILRYVPAGQVYPVDVPAGTEVEGRAAELALALGIAEPVKDRKSKAAAAAPENK